MRTKLLLTFVAGLFSLTAFAQKLGQEMAVYAEKKGNDYYLFRLTQDQPTPKVYLYSNGETKPYKNYKTLKDVAVDFPGIATYHQSAKEELVSVLNKNNHLYEVSSQRKNDKTIVTVYEISNGQKKILKEYNSIYELEASPYKDAIFIDIKK
ncbi:hypothetical protein [Chryseobacterium limigenitum]|uniref:Beta-lactamase-inhibitor-like, PepSY-like n=1 Tax=Chryseobacterium limigenitum TaxID=1612149 RepID=A0A1K2IDS3_9FLAO|nr:hypothetical protein [Chryseobacterium limigenitum]SFZ90545.1 hypothetical protein SAMN05216324_101408 [Chryseobacterium limigenitum]